MEFRLPGLAFASLIVLVNVIFSACHMYIFHIAYTFLRCTVDLVFHNEATIFVSMLEAYADGI